MFYELTRVNTEVLITELNVRCIGPHYTEIFRGDRIVQAHLNILMRLP